MRKNRPSKLFYLAGLFALGLMVIAGRLWLMQVDDESPFRNGAEMVRQRRVPFFPSRARILDANGEVIADNSSAWEVHTNLWAMLHPAKVLDRSRLAPEAYPSQQELLAFYQDKIQPVLKAEYASPKHPRLFFALWELRSEPILVKDRATTLDLLNQTLELDERVLEAKIRLVEDEVNALAARAEADPEKLSSSYLAAKRALRDSNYWQDILRFPKSMLLEHSLEARQEVGDELVSLLEELSLAIEERPELAKDYLKKAHALALANKAKEQAPKSDEDEEEIQLRFNAYPSEEELEATQAEEARKLWVSMESITRNLMNYEEPAEASLERLQHIQVYLRSTSEEARGLRENLDHAIFGAVRAYHAIGLADRLAKLRARTYEGEADSRKLRSEYEARWIGYLNFTEEHDARLQTNPLRISRKATREAVELLKIHADSLDGIIFRPRAERVVRYAELMAHLLGSMAKPTPDNIQKELERLSASPNLNELLSDYFQNDSDAMERAFSGSVAEHPIGSTGIEGYYESRLAGEPGARISYVDARGRVREIQGEWNTTPSKDLELTIDLDTQAFAAEVFQKYEKKFGAKVMRKNPWRDHIPQEMWSLRGSFAMMDLETGAIIAMISYPSYDPKLLSAPTIAGEAYRKEILKGGSEADWPKAYHFLKKSPLYDRAVAAKHAPGSTMKLLTFLAALESKSISPNFTYVDNELVHKATNSRTGHITYQEIDIAQAISCSSNGMTYEVSTKFKGGSAAERYATTMLPWLNKFGFGEKPGLDVAGLQSAGRLPAVSGMSSGALANAAIGQGDVEASLLQVLRFYGALATRGKLFTPHIAREGARPPKIIEVSDSTWDILHKGMRGVTKTSNGGLVDGSFVKGTATKCKSLLRINAAGKTGTAQIGKFRTPEGEIAHKPDHAWFAGFAPYDKPRVAFVALAEYSHLFGADVGDICGEIAEHWLAKEAAKSNSAHAAQMKR